MAKKLQLSGMSSLTDIASGCSDNGKTTDLLTQHQYSAMSKHSLVTDTPKGIGEWLTSLPPDFRANRFHPLEKCGDHKMSAICGPPLFELYEPSSHAGLSLRTCGDFFLVDISNQSSVTLPTMGIVRDGFVYELPMSELGISGTGSGLWPTPKSNEPGMSAKTSGRTVEKSTHLTTQVALAEGMLNEDGNLWPTPMSGSDSGSVRGLNGSARMRDKLKSMVGIDEQKRMCSRFLNPDWVEWLMGWPDGWSDLAPLSEVVWPDWGVDPGDSGRIPRTTPVKCNRTNRLKMLGNGWVPQCAAKAYTLLEGVL